jgi:polysaccharide pyruvyl transferase WcaK-like protein
MKKNLKVLIGGAPFGDTNYGEDAILAADVKILRNIDPNIEISVLTHEPKRTQAWLGIRAYPRGDGRRNPRLIQHIMLMRETDVFAFGGTTMLSDSPNLPLRMIFLAKLMGKPVMTFPCGMNPIPSKTTRLVMKYLLRHTDLLIVRDEETKNLFEEYGVDIPIHVAADQVFLLQSTDKESERARLLDENPFLKGPRPLVAVSLIHTRIVPLSELVKTSNYLIDDLGYSILFFPTQPDDRYDLTASVMKEVSKKDHCFVFRRRYLPEEILAMLGYVTFAVSSRLHFLISCAVANVPSVALSRSQKIDNFLRIMNQELAGSMEEITFEDLKVKVDHLHKNLAYEKKQLTQNMIHARNLALASKDLVRDFLERV